MDYITKWPNQCKIGGYLMGRQRQGHSQRGGQGVGEWQEETLAAYPGSPPSAENINGPYLTPHMQRDSREKKGKNMELEENAEESF